MVECQDKAYVGDLDRVCWGLVLCNRDRSLMLKHCIVLRTTVLVAFLGSSGIDVS